jgi:hypothetical protein
MNDLLEKEITRLIRIAELDRGYCCGDVMHLYDEDVEKLMRELAEFVIKQAAEVARKNGIFTEIPASTSCELAENAGFKKGYNLCRSDIATAILAMTDRHE